MPTDRRVTRINVLKGHLKSSPDNLISCIQHENTSAPQSYKQLLLVKKSTNYREASKLTVVPSLPEPNANQILVKHAYAGVQGSEILISNGVYGPLSYQEPPVIAGSEGCGVIVKKGSNVTKLQVGQAVLFAAPAFTEYSLMRAEHVFPIREVAPEAVSILVSGTTAYLALQERARMNFETKAQKQLKVLVTGAAGATGSFAVQLAKLAGHYVIGTCGGEDKVQQLKELGCDHIINYKQEDVSQVLKEIGGVDVVYEGVGGEMFHKCFNALKPDGIFIIIGFISQYKSERDSQSKEQLKKLFAGSSVPAMANHLLMGNREMSGFFLPPYMYEKPKIPIWRNAVEKMLEMYYAGKLKIPIDAYCAEHFTNGTESVVDAIDRLQSGKNVGKVFVTFNK